MGYLTSASPQFLPQSPLPHLMSRSEVTEMSQYLQFNHRFFCCCSNFLLKFHPSHGPLGSDSLACIKINLSLSDSLLPNVLLHPFPLPTLYFRPWIGVCLRDWAVNSQVAGSSCSCLIHLSIHMALSALRASSQDTTEVRIHFSVTGLESLTLSKASGRWQVESSFLLTSLEV